MKEPGSRKRNKSSLSIQLAELREQIRSLQDSNVQRAGDNPIRVGDEVCKSLIEDSPVFLTIVGPDGKILFMNEAILQVVGRNAEEVIGKDYLASFIPEKDHDRLGRMLGGIGPAPGAVTVETGIVSGDGELRLVEWHGRAILNHEKLLRITYCVGIDVTENRCNSEELLQTKDYLENVLEYSPDAIGIVDRHGRFIQWNRMAEELYGYSFEELRGKTAFDLYADADELEFLLSMLSKHGSVKNFETSMKRKDGSILPFDVSISLLKDAGNCVLGSVCVARNLSEIKNTLNTLEATNNQLQEEMHKRQQALDALERSQNQYRTIFENTGNATIIVEENTTISLANAEFARISGYTKEEIEGKKSWTEFFSDECLAQMKEYHRLRRIDPRAAPRGYEARFKTLQNQNRDMLLTVAVIPGTRKSVVSLSDITERKLAEQELRRSHQELEQRSYEISLLNEMLNLLQVCGTGDESYYVLGNYVRKLFPTDSGSLYLLNDSRKKLEVAFAWGDSSESEKGFEYDSCWALRQGKVHMVENQEGVVCAHLRTTPAAGYLCVPMIAQSEVIGLFHLRCNPSDLGYPETHRKIMFLKQRLAIAIADHIGLALANLKMRETLRMQSIKDPLTGLFNRRFMEESLSREIRRAKRHGSPLSIIMLDLDYFKEFNDAHGHEVGDLLLAEMGGLLNRTVRGQDVVCRYGGEEFLIIMSGASVDDAAKRAESIREEIKNLRIFHKGRSFGQVSASLGVAVYSGDSDAASEMLHAADEALYLAKNRGRDCVMVGDRDHGDSAGVRR